MCGRYTARTKQTDLINHFSAKGVLFDHSERFNIAPSQDVSAITALERPDQRILEKLRWGLVPFWARDTSMASRMINARSETVFEKPAFRGAIRSRRCLIPTTGFYEWHQKTKVPHLISLNSAALFAFAGLYEEWTSPDGSPLRSCTILTTDANDAIRDLHERMPVIVHPRNYSLWLDARIKTNLELAHLFHPWSESDTVVWEVAKRVGNVANDDPFLMEKATLL
jgi:putative SOS response-associated peptidase YedK